PPSHNRPVRILLSPWERMIIAVKRLFLFAKYPMHTTTTLPQLHQNSITPLEVPHPTACLSPRHLQRYPITTVRYVLVPSSKMAMVGTNTSARTLSSLLPLPKRKL